MRSIRVHVDSELAAGMEIALPQAQSHYLKHVLRLQPGAAFFLFNGREAVDYAATLTADGKRLGASIESAQALENESPLQSQLLQSLGRADHMDWMIQKTTELGVNRISLFPTERTQTPIKPAQLDKKLAHWRGVAISACEQCGRAVVPAIQYHANLDHAIADCESELRLLLEFSGKPLTSALERPQSSVSILLGPEGGLNTAEVQAAEAKHFIPVTLGPRTLRTETAATSSLAITQAVLGDLG